MLMVLQIHVIHMPDFRAVKCFMVVHPCEINIRRGLIAECCKLFELELPLILIDSAETDLCRKFPVDYAQLQKRIQRQGRDV
jgi:hypothetical protein